MALAAAALLLLAQCVALTSSAGAGSGDLEVEVTNCEAEPTGESCSEQTESVDRTDSRSIAIPQRKPAPVPRREVHEVSLATGEHRVATEDGEEQAGEVRVELDAKKPHDQAGEKPPPAPDALPPVKTNGGGSPFSGFGAGFDFVSGDEALNRFSVPPFLLPIYIAAGRSYGVPWNVLASINQIETDFGRIGHQVSSAGALGWMQFMPGTWRMYGVDASGDGVADPFNPVDAIYAAARYLKASGAGTDLRRAIFAYNHADWYVDSVLKTASVYGSLPAGLVAETGSLAFGRFPVRGPVSYGDDFRRAQSTGARPTGLAIEGRPGATAIATQDVTVERVLLDRRLARGVERPAADPEPAAPAPPASSPLALIELAEVVQLLTGRDVVLPVARLATAEPPARPRRTEGTRLPNGYGRTRGRGVEVIVEDAVGNQFRYAGLRRLASGVRPGARVRGGRPLGRLASTRRPRLLFSARAAGGAPVDPRPLVDGYRLQEAADFYNVTKPLGGNPFVPDPATVRSRAGVFVGGSASGLAREVLADPGIQLYPCGREDVERGIVDKRVLGALLYLRRNGLTLTVTSLRCGHGYYTAGGSVSAHSYGAAVDIAAFNGQPVMGHQGPGSLTEEAIKLLMQLPDAARPSQLISLMDFGGPSFPLADHDDHLHVGYEFQPSLGVGRSGAALGRVNFSGGGGAGLEPGKVAKGVEARLSRKLGAIRNPSVRDAHGAGSIRVEGERESDAAAAERLARRRSALTAQPTSAGARLVDVDVPEGARGDETYALATLKPAGQVVVLAHRGGAWRHVGAPVDGRGRVVNPPLRGLATVRGGAGYAVGDRGAVVLLRANRAPLLLRSPSRAPLATVDVVRRGGRLTGFAAGSGRSGVALAGTRVARERLPGDAAITSLRMRSDGTVLAAGTVAASPKPGLHLRDAGWGEGPSVPLPDGVTGRITSFTWDGDDLWVAGGLSAPSAGIPVEAPFAARSSGGRWTTFCAPPAGLAAVSELGEDSGGVCDRPLPMDPSNRGPAAGIAATRRGVVLATPAAVLLSSSNTFRPLPGAAGPSNAGDVVPGWSNVAVALDGQGWALAAHGRMARITPASGTAQLARLPLAGGGVSERLQLATVQSGARALAFRGSSAAQLASGRWSAGGGMGLPVRDVAWAGSGEVWALDGPLGAIVRGADGRWTVPGRNDLDRSMRVGVLEAVGGDGLVPTGDNEAGFGFRALAFRSAAEGYAVGDRGQIARYDGTSWRRERSGVDRDLHGVAVAATGVLAVGDRGTLLQRSGGRWRAARTAAGTRDFSAAGSASDGTLLAAGDGAVLALDRDGGWHRLPLDPLGVRVAEISGYRGRDGALHVLALVDDEGSPALLEGGPGGWRPVHAGAATAVEDFALDHRAKRIWLAGSSDGRTVVTQRPLAGRR